jgi:DNA topoisomerase-2
MAQDFVGANNIPWLVPQGQFGTRLLGGEDSASPRYIHTYLQPRVRKLVPEADFPVLTYRDDDGLPVEPEWYAPVLPMLLVNGARGIGTGYSTYIPPCNPRVLKDSLKKWLQGDDAALYDPIVPHFEGFKGSMTADGIVVGVYKKEKDEFVVTELPPGTWTAKYREFLEKELAEGRIKDFVDTSTDVTVNIRIRGMDEKVLQKSLTDRIKTTNMHAFNSKGVITKYATLNDILREFATVRLELYEKRRQYQMEALRKELPYHENVMRFIEDQISDAPKIDLRRQSKADCDRILTGGGYTKLEDSFEYILKLPVSSFTSEAILKHRTKLTALRAEIETLNKTNARAMWLADLQQV